MPSREIDTVINFICRIVLLLMEGIYLFVILCTYARGILLHVHNRLLRLVISTTRTTYQPIAVHEIQFRFDLEGNVGYRIGDLLNEDDFLHPWNTAPTPPPPTTPSSGTPDLPTSPLRSYTPVIIENEPLSPTQLASAQRTPSPSPLPSTGWDPLDLLRARIEELNNRSNPEPPSTRGNTPDYENYETADELDMTTLLELINNLALNTDPPANTSPKSTDTPSTPFTFDPNPSDTLDIPPPPSPNPFQPPGPDYGWGNK
ncbi:hypothetical protein JAAARDRAFT_201376 [Jaapia argillacea MUCL 33604]|uniref:Uncharacterized protein n=1 Tax=Jaapia argillacea MUCL 33604 TaxID=933084 RepID=A0A067P4V0_9AGAM|nr:hypothetical protein JAAARDRAFT_201376 [Jaapia argillacea MUCL 33604]